MSVEDCPECSAAVFFSEGRDQVVFDVDLQLVQSAHPAEIAAVMSFLRVSCTSCFLSMWTFWVGVFRGSHARAMQRLLGSLEASLHLLVSYML